MRKRRPIRRWAMLASLLLIAGSTRAADSFFALRVSSPLAASGSVGVRFGVPEEAGFHPVAEIEAGLGGGKVMVGLDSLGDGFGAGVKASLLRTWLWPIDAEEDQVYLGMDLQGGYGQLFVEAGGYRRVDGNDGDDWLASLGMGFRF